MTNELDIRNEAALDLVSLGALRRVFNASVRYLKSNLQALQWKPGSTAVWTGQHDTAVCGRR